MATRAQKSPTLDGHALIAAIAAGNRAIERNRDVINALNVFPVPDGDTGTNMALTMQAVVADARSKADASASVVAALMARSALLAARGNSGLILAQFFKGVAGATNGHHVVDAAVFRRALRLAVEAAYKAVPDPKEGTMLTVFREAAEAAEAVSGPDLLEVWACAAEQARLSVARTPELLDVLREAGVVDAGGFGFAALLVGGLAHLKDQSDGDVLLTVPGFDATSAAGVKIRSEFMQKVEAEAWGYCVSFAIEGQGLDPDGIRSHAAGIGKSCVVAGDDRQVKVHVHSLNPGEALSYGVGLGTLSNISILNMDEQQEEWSEERKTREAPDRGTRDHTGKGSDHLAVSIAVVAVAVGDGLQKLFLANGLGACSIVRGGDTMNPSTGDLVAAVESAPSGTVIILPNNKNVVGTARQVSALTKKKVAVVPTLSVQAGVGALLAFSPDQSLETNLRAMQAAADGVRAGAICRATRDSTVDGQSVKEGQAMGLLDGRLIAVGDGVEEVAARMLSSSAIGAELLTIYRGQSTSRPDAERLVRILGQALPGTEIEIVDGDQPNYPYLMAIE